MYHENKTLNECKNTYIILESILTQKIDVNVCFLDSDNGIFCRYFLFHLTFGKIFSLKNMAIVCPKMCCKTFENQLVITKYLSKNNFE